MLVFPRLLSTLTRLLFEFRSPPRSPGRVTFEVRSPEDLSTALLRSVLLAVFRVLEVLRSVVDGRDVAVLGLETSREADLLYPPFTEGLVVGRVVVGLLLGRLAGLLCRVDGRLVCAGLLLGLDMELREGLWPIRWASSSTGASINKRAGTAIFKNVMESDFIRKKVLIV